MQHLSLFLIIGITIYVSMQAFKDAALKSKWTFSPYAVKHYNEGKRVFSHMWIHLDTQHLIFNMISLYFLGEVLLKEFVFAYGVTDGNIKFVSLYLIGGVMATVIPYLRHKDNPSYRSLGASGAVSAVVFGAIIWNPEMRLGFFFLPFYFPAYWFGIGYLIYEFYMDRKGNTGIAHDAHIGGAVTGIIYILVINFPKGQAFLDSFL